MICYDMFSTNDIYLVDTGRLTLTGSTCGHFNTVALKHNEDTFQLREDIRTVLKDHI